MQQGEHTSSYYQFNQPNLQNPNPSSNPNDHNPTQLPATYASAPPVSSSYSSSENYNYASTYLPYFQNPDHVLNPPPTAPTYPTAPNFESSNPSQPSFFHNFQLVDQNQAHVNYAPANLGQCSDYNLSMPNSLYSAPYNHQSTSTVPNYEHPYRDGGYFDEDYGRYDARHGGGEIRDDVMGGGVYAYEGGKVEPYGARGTGSETSNSVLFDDYGRPIKVPGPKEQVAPGSSGMIAKAIPKADTHEDVKSGVQKFRVKLLSEGGGQSNMDVLCQIGLDGIRVLDPATSLTLRIYPLETVTRWEVLDTSIFAFWAKSAIDVEPRRVRLQSSSYTRNAILDTVTAATVQLKEMGGRNKASDSLKVSDQLVEKKKGFPDWMNLMKPGNEERDHWVPDEEVTKCTACGTDFGAFVRKHHCRNCGDIFCDKCTQGRIALTAEVDAQPVRVCDRCMAEVTQRLSYAREGSGKIVGMQSHDDLAKKLQEEIERNRKTSSGVKSGEYGMQMREVACPTCTVHLQVQVPTSGSETTECSVCQHPFLVSA